MLYIVPTPIGNLEDMTYRAIRVLKEVDLIACEDTRVSRKLLNHFDIKTKLISHHQHNENASSDKLIDMLQNDMNIAIISDAGTPAISDPGNIIIKKCIENNLKYTVLPGANAIIPSFVLSNFSAPFTYIGFLDRNKRKNELEKYEKYETSLIFYESPHRIKSTLEEMKSVLGNRRISIIREISKLYEEVVHIDIDGAILKYSSETPKGEFVIIVEKYICEKIEYSQEQILEIAKNMFKDGIRKKEIAKELSKKYSANRQDIYKYISKW